jgi:8-amino-7-oxononanoate synthase
MSDYKLRFDLAPIVARAVQLRTRFADFAAIGASAYSSLFDRPNIGPVGDHAILGPPARNEFASVQDAVVSVIDLASSGYLGLGNDSRVKAAAQSAIDQFGTHTGGCRILSGTTPIHFELEERLARFVRAPAVVTYSSGYVTNLSVISSLFHTGDVIILDRHAHRSLYDGALLSRATIKRFRHNDLDHLDRVLRRTTGARRRLVAVDAVYSMEGDLAPLPQLVELVRRHDVFLLVDEAHALGVLGDGGRGTIEHFGLDPTQIDIRIGTLSKALAAAGGFAAVHESIGAILRYASAGRVFSAAMTPADTAAALAALGILECEPRLVHRLRSNVMHFRAELSSRGIGTVDTAAAIVPLRVGSSPATLEAALRLLRRGLFLNAVIAPAVPAGTERLRCLVSAGHRADDLASAAEAIANVFAELRIAHLDISFAGTATSSRTIRAGRAAS